VYKRQEIALTMLPGIGDVSGKKLVACCGGLEAVFKESRKELLLKHTMGENLIHRLLDGRNEALRRAEKEIRFIQKYRIKPLFFLNKDYPYRLANCHDAPLMLYYKGSVDVNKPRVVSVVGTRNATDYGREVCTRIIEGLQESGVLVVSGLAFGIDSCAHKCALQYNIPTVGVLGHGLDRIYPLQNKTLAEKMILNGGLITDFPSETMPDRENFPKRNRIIAGLCDALVVVEAASSGGALITADIANSYNRDVFAVPGRLQDEYSKGCNTFIKTNRAALVESADDIRYIMGWDVVTPKKKVMQREMFQDYSTDEKIIVDLLHTQSDVGIDILVSDSGLKSSIVAKVLLSLELRGVIRCLPGKRYQLN
jgi:DNA processing protein